MTSVTIGPGDGTTDIAAVINAALADPAVTTVILGEGVFLLHSPIFIPSGKTLDGAGRDLTILRAAEDFDRVAPGEGDGVVNSEVGAVGITLTDFSIDAAKLTPDGTRMVGCFMKQATGFTIARVDVYNATAYGHFAQGDTVNYAPYASGTYDDCGVYNCQIAFEQMACDGITLTDCVAGDGDGDLAGTYFHPLTGSKNITYINCRATGFANVGFELTANVDPLENIRIIDCSVEMLGDGAALVAAGEFQTFGLELIRSSFVSHGNSAALLYGTIGTALDCYFQGARIGIAFYDSPLGEPSVFTLTDSHVLGLTDPLGGAAAFGVSTDGGTIVWDGGSIEARGPAVISVSGPLTVTPGTQIILDGFDVVVTYMEQGAPKPIAPSILLPGSGFGSFADGSLVVDYLANAMQDDWLGVAHRGNAIGQIGVFGDEISYGGIVIGTVSGGAGGADLRIILTAAATGEAVQALMQAITFANDSENPGSTTRLLDFIVTDGAGKTGKATAAVGLITHNNAPLIDLADPPGDAILAYSENDVAAIAPAAIVSDVDSPDFSGGALTVSFTANGGAEDFLSILDQGSGPGQVGVSGNIVSWGGVAIGTLSGGLGGAPLTVAFNQQANANAVQALTRAVTYHNVSDTPSLEPRTIQFTLTDGDGAGAIPISAVVELQAVDDQAVAADDQASVFENALLSAGVIGNDIDPDGPALEIVAVNGAAPQVGAKIVLASGALLTLRADGRYDYDPNGKFDALASSASGAVNSTDTDSFTYTLAGGDTATVTITIEGVASPGGRLEGDGRDNMIIGTAGADSFFLEQGGNDVINAGGGDDSIYYGGAYSAADLTAGGAGTDTLILFGSYAVGLGAESIVGIERLVLESGSALPAGLPNLYAITTANGNLASGEVLQVLAGQLQADEGLIFNASAEADGRFIVESGLGNDVITLGGGADLVHSGGGNDRIDGGSGADLLHGGQGDDLYFIDNAGDLVVENGGEGDDEVRTGLAVYRLTPGVERLTGTSTTGQALSGNDLINVIAGASGNDIVDGGLGADTMAGGQGNDLFIVDNAGDTVTERDEQGVDQVRTDLAVYSLAGVAYVENLTGGAADQTLTGNGFNNVIDGGAGADAMAGGGGHDVYIVDNLGDKVIELNGAGTDEVRTSLGSKAPPERAVYVLPDFVENLTGTSAGAQGVRDNALNNVITMGVGHDLVVADAGGIDTINGGAGNDFVYHGDKLTAADITNGGAGTDTIALLGNYGSGITFTASNLVGVERMALYTSLYLPGTGPNNYAITLNDANVAAGTEFFVTAASLQSNEVLTFNGSAETNGRFTVHGGGAADTITGGAGGDFFLGNGGNDTLYGLGGTDFLIGGLGADLLRGGAGADRFVYQSAVQSTIGSVDKILDFQHVDRIDLTGIDANGNAADGNSAFTFIGANAFGNVAGQLRAYQSGAGWFVEGDVNGDGLADLVIQVTLPDATPLGAGDFFL